MMAIPAPSPDDRLVLDYRPGGAPAPPWRPVDDRVMGGQSQSRWRAAAMHAGGAEATARFEGTVSLADGGGFASVRSPAVDGLAPADALRLAVRGDGRPYVLKLYVRDQPDSFGYQAVFHPPSDAWDIVHVPMEAFEAAFRGREQPGHEPVDPAVTRGLGLRTADRTPGPFRLGVGWIAASARPA